MISEHFLSTCDAARWKDFLPCSRSVFGSHGYARICERFRNCSPRLYVAKSGESTICYPVYLRSLSDLPFAPDIRGKWDSTSPDFCGPLMRGGDHSLSLQFPSLRDRLFSEHEVIAEFAHLHPWREPEVLPLAECSTNREIVWVDTTLSSETLWTTHCEHACRKNINTAQRQGVTIHEGSNDQHIGEFYRIYRNTMERNNASAAYYFSFEFFKAFRDELPLNSRFTFAEHRGRIVAATLYLHDDENVFSFLGGADAEYQLMRPTNLVIWETIRWAHQAGKKRLILGGGYKENDGIFRFKSTFSKFRKAFQVYKKVHRPDEYHLLDSLCRQRNGLENEAIQYFPAYRFERGNS